MKKKISIIFSILFAMVLGFGVFASETKAPEKESTPPCEIEVSEPAKEVKQTKKAPVIRLTNLTDPLCVVKNPKAYLGKRINVVAKFNKFATLGLDYKPAMRSSENYISFLIFRTDTDKKIPLPEMKLFIKRDLAEKSIELKENDNIQFSGVIFSNALGDVWIDVDKLDKLN